MLANSALPSVNLAIPPLAGFQYKNKTTLRSWVALWDSRVPVRGLPQIALAFPTRGCTLYCDFKSKS
jgi:hypothetical protein